MKRKNIRIPNVPGPTFGKIQQAANKKGEFICDMLRPKLRNIVESYPAEMREPAKIEKSKEIKIPGVSPEVFEQLQNIADHLGIDRTTFLRSEIKKIADNLPAIR